VASAQIDQPSITQLSINTIRTLSMDAVQQANSGHPGTPMALAPLAYCLWQRFLRYDPADPMWPNRDRFVLSNGHASMLLYSLLHLAQVKEVSHDGKRTGLPAVSLDDIKHFRQIGSKTPGHPEHGLTSGVETTTGPLGQGVATSIGMAMAERWLSAHFNRPGQELVDYNVYVFCGDGDLMEGVSGEAASLAGHLHLSNLCWVYDNNHITIEGSTSLAFSEDVATRFVGYGWNVTRVADANDLDMLSRAFHVFQDTHDRPTLIIVDSHIGYGAPDKQDTKEAHGEALGEDEVRKAKHFYGWPEDAKFLVPDGVYADFSQGVGKRGAEANAAWKAKWAAYRSALPDLGGEFELMLQHELPAGWDQNLPVFAADPKGLATRDSSAKVLNVLAQKIPWFFGGSADLYPSTKTRLTFEGAGEFEAGNYAGRNLHLGIREHGMVALSNGLALSNIRPYCSTFFIFTDYCKPSIRLSALMELPVTYIMTHDSIGLGEDGPTHQSIEQLAALRAMPGIVVLRPADANEVLECYKLALRRIQGPTMLVLTRQPLPTLDRSKYSPAAGVQKGAYILADAPGGKPDVILMGTGSEVSLCVQAYEQLSAQGVGVRLVSIPSWELFRAQPKDYRDSVFPPSVTARVAVEAASHLGWREFIGATGEMIGMTTFGASAPLKDVMKHFGFTVDHVIEAVKAQLGKR